MSEYKLIKLGPEDSHTGKDSDEGGVTLSPRYDCPFSWGGPQLNGKPKFRRQAATFSPDRTPPLASNSSCLHHSHLAFLTTPRDGPSKPRLLSLNFWIIDDLARPTVSSTTNRDVIPSTGPDNDSKNTLSCSLNLQSPRPIRKCTLFDFCVPRTNEPTRQLSSSNNL